MTPQNIYHSDTYAGYQRLHAELTDYRGYEPYDLLPKDAWGNARAAALSREPDDSTDYLKALIKVPAVRRSGPVGTDKVETIEVLHNVQITGRPGVAHQIDVYWRYLKGGV